MTAHVTLSLSLLTSVFLGCRWVWITLPMVMKIARGNRQPLVQGLAQSKELAKS